MNSFQYTKVSSVEAGLDSKKQSFDHRFIAGGTNLLDLWKYNLIHPHVLIDLNGINECKTISSNEHGGLHLGALMTNADTAYHPLITERFPILSRAILAGASAQIRNSATNGGNLMQRTRCYYFYDPEVPCNKRIPGSGCPAKEGYNRMHAILGASDDCIAVFPSDMCVALSVLDAIIHVIGPDGPRKIPFSDFHRLPGDTPEIDNSLSAHELITSIELPPQHFTQHYSYLKLRDRHSYAFALVSVATVLEVENGLVKTARISLGGVAHKPWRSLAGEALLVGKPPIRESFAAAADVILSGAVGYKHNSFKIELAKRAIIRNCMMALDPASQQPGAQPSK